MSEQELGPERTFPGSDSNDIGDLKSPKDVERELKDAGVEVNEDEN